MAFAVSQQLNRYYNLYKDIDVTFSKEVVSTLNFDPKQVFVRCSGGQWPCIINSASMTKAKIICGKKSGFIDKLRSGITSVNIRFAFFDTEGKESLSFFVAAKLVGISSYETGSHELVLITFEYTQRAPDDLIEKLGILLEANINSQKRQNERVAITPEISRRIGLVEKGTVVYVDAIPRRCIIRDLSFSGAKILLVGVANFLMNKEVTLRFAFDDPRSVFGIKGRIVRTEPVEGRKDLVALAVNYYPQNIPMMYKMYLNKHFSVVRKSHSDGFGDDFLEDVAPASSVPPISPPASNNAAPLEPPHEDVVPEHPLEK
ncbi:cyclic di-GMP binding protein [Treponema putidum]|uniref:PilZ domain-containing protein n=1 Tax=Treponema putidum TaxID=221027 RepID=A0AAE9SKT4_9SPIR|nr:cyclic di-GMP binding protein [Treponema putidum]AIN93470.1 pilus assembly protein PilZ [Treponema putidum]TWI72344.1 PilZ domain-containing protein [Treponema putidum]UTY29717.1 PilZ domain-containing protein [Treponema putidum]UTY32183.1 PilZ domain-containing protein [Treponema putidum]UTY34577.1 PilZ domain-containing protein [Treponema putidum]